MYVWLLFYDECGWNASMTTTLVDIFATQELAEYAKVRVEVADGDYCHVTRWEIKQ